MAKKTLGDKLDENTAATKDATAAQREGNVANFAIAANMGAVAAAEQAKADAMEDRNELESERIKNEIEARKDLKEHNKRMANVETMKAVRTDTEGGVERYDQVQKDELDRQNQQELLDLLGDCIATIETDGKPNDKFDLPAYSGEESDIEALQKVAETAGRGGMFASLSAQSKLKASMKSKEAKGISHAYSYHNLGGAIAKLIDLREELQRIRVWDMNVSREATHDKIERYLKEGKEKQKKAAVKTVKSWKKEEESFLEKRKSTLMKGIGTLLLSPILLAVAFIIKPDPWFLFVVIIPGLIGLAMLLDLPSADSFYKAQSKFQDNSRIDPNKKWWKPIGWEDILEIYEEEG